MRCSCGEELEKKVVNGKTVYMCPEHEILKGFNKLNMLFKDKSLINAYTDSDSLIMKVWIFHYQHGILIQCYTIPQELPIFKLPSVGRISFGRPKISYYPSENFVSVTLPAKNYHSPVIWRKEENPRRVFLKARKLLEKWAAHLQEEYSECEFVAKE